MVRGEEHAGTQRDVSVVWIGVVGVFLIVGVSLVTTLWPLLPLLSGGSAGMTPGFVFWLPFLIPVLIVVSILAIVLSAVRADEGDTGTTPDPLDVLEHRYTNGEIDLDEYERRLEQLFEIEGDVDIDPRVERLAIRYARGDLNGRSLDREMERLSAANPDVSPDDVDRFLRVAFAVDGRDELEQDVGTESGTGHEWPTTVDPQLSTTADVDAVERLRRRYAEGELTDEEYQRRLAVLRETA
ncbi:SHOCT domain-containing protein [Halorubrum vacuolatum]|uniref:Uncharacterized membrane protein n=1 Tax=Halorubrum vacuolatum TaxID=63740 RepID=A0A238WPI5_HALVU|nr:SHOCT domain-containing protein [Halorubrum vacuolatum]SNR48462.1 Uncharacterized membrane protein [Halorubrum vacuolatum]